MRTGPATPLVAGWRAAWAALTALVLTSAVLGACSFDGLAFRRDDRLQIDNLADRSLIDLPFELRYSFDGELGGDGAVAFGVLVDWTPPPPGTSLERLLDGDPACGGPTGCPEGYLDRNRIYVTTATALVLDNVPVGTDREERRGYHEVTIVLVDDQGRRVGETAAYARFRVPGRDA